MANDLRLYSSNGMLVVLSDTSVYGARYGGSVGALPITQVFAEVWGRGFAPLVGVSYGNRQASLNLLLRGTNQDNWVQQYRNLQQILIDCREWWAPQDGKAPGQAGARAWLSVTLPGQSNPLEFDILTGQLDAGKEFEANLTLPAPIQIDVPLTLTLRPYGHPQALTRTVSSTINNGGGTSATSDHAILTAPAGEEQTPVRLMVQPVGTPFNRVIMGRKTGVNLSNFIFAMDCETSAHTGYTSAQVNPLSTGASSANNADAGSHGGNTRRNTTAADTISSVQNIILQKFTITANLKDFEGEYRVFQRVQTYPAHSPVLGWYCGYGGAAGTDILGTPIAAVGSSGSTGILEEVGRIRIPHRNLPGTAVLTSFAFTIGVQIKAMTMTAGEHLDLDCVYLVPADEQTADLALTGTSLSQNSGEMVLDNLRLPTPMNYLLDSSGNFDATLVNTIADSRFTARQGMDNGWYPLLLRGGNSHNLGDTLNLTWDYWPYFSQVR